MRFASCLLPLLVLLAACSAPDPDAQQIIDTAIATHGGEGYENVEIDFTFRGTAFQIVHDGGRFAYTRTLVDTVGQTVRDVLANGGLTRTIDGDTVDLDAAATERIMTAVNSVPYFVLLPYRLNDPAVQKAYAGDVTIRGEPYHQIEVTFREEGGGEDFDDVYMYWIHQDRGTMDYLAYTFEESDEGRGSRFREAVNARTVNGLRFADYVNYATDWSVIDGDLSRYPALFETGNIDTFSVIETEDVVVR